MTAELEERRAAKKRKQSGSQAKAQPPEGAPDVENAPVSKEARKAERRSASMFLSSGTPLLYSLSVVTEWK